jgi:hypothetical protein
MIDDDDDDDDDDDEVSTHVADRFHWHEFLCLHARRHAYATPGLALPSAAFWGAAPPPSGTPLLRRLGRKRGRTAGTDSDLCALCGPGLCR